MNKIIFFALIIFSVVCLNGQMKSDLKIALSKARNYTQAEKYSQAIYVLNSSINSRNKEESFSLACLYAYKSSVYRVEKRFKESNNAINIAKEYAVKSNSNYANAYVYSSSSRLFDDLKISDLCVNEAQKALKFLECDKSGNSVEKAEIYVNTYLSLYNTNMIWKNKNNVEKFARLSLKYAKISKDPSCLSNGYLAMFGLHSLYPVSQKKNADSMMYYAQLNFLVCQKYPLKCGYRNYARAAMNIAGTLLRESSGKNVNKKESFEYLQLARDIVSKYKINPNSIVPNTYGIMASYAEIENKIDEAVKYYKLAETELKKSKNTSYREYLFQMALYKDLADLYERQLDYKKALFYSNQLMELSKKTADQQQIENAQKLEIQYEIEKKNIELATLKERAENRKLQNYLYLGIICVTLLGLGFMFRSYHYKLKYSSQRERELEAKKIEAELQIKLGKEEKTRLSLERELLAVKQSQLQKEMIASSLQLSKKNDVLQQIRAKVNEGETHQINKLIKEETLRDHSFAEIKSLAQQLPPDFFNLLNEKSVKKLSQLDIKYCACLHLQMNTKQIAGLLHIEAKSVRVAKYRIKKKLGLGKDDDLDLFLQKI
ncbi:MULTISPECIES: helix-turn-helix transcriptional regulator [unclassified Chryseobacterium]|uniref:helix-turn-helix transcriptional regulator n=1 Tax=unclassified Chryseobacterium TaxID=2593645 RepID=UPI000D3D5593|nr:MULTISPECIES: hypothetical protein [unclassified Chryseobacterium]PTT70929.1 hypothetical protein DBR25_17660 [Chryseobacterium sp. HMWF001]PVV55231.1 hypothetical protein DD829_15320 [Chryseobacterium sp. HMWF035]